MDFTKYPLVELQKTLANVNIDIEHYTYRLAATNSRVERDLIVDRLANDHDIVEKILQELNYRVSHGDDE